MKYDTVYAVVRVR